MKQQPFVFFLLCSSLAGLVLAGTINEEMIRIRDSYSDFLKDFPKADPSQRPLGSIPKSAGFGQSKSSPKLSGDYYNQVSKSAYEKQQIMQTLSTLAQTLANTAGSAYAFESAKQAAAQGAALSASSDPQFQQMGQLFSQESQQIANNDRVGADNTAAQIQGVPAPYVAPGYQPTQGESIIVQAFNFAVGGILQSLGGVLGGTAISSLLKGLGIGGYGGYGTGYSTGTGLVGAAYNGQSAVPVLNNGGAGAIQTGAGAVQNQVYQIPQMQQPVTAKQSCALPGS
jgi:hypothetical protein